MTFKVIVKIEIRNAEDELVNSKGYATLGAPGEFSTKQVAAENEDIKEAWNKANAIFSMVTSAKKLG
jgi:hypothetical protein